MSIGDIYRRRLKYIPSNLGTGTANSSTYFRGDKTFNTVSTSVNTSQLENLSILNSWTIFPTYYSYKNLLLDNFNNQSMIDTVNSTCTYLSNEKCYVPFSLSSSTTNISTSQVDCSGWYDISSATVTQTTPGDVTASIIYHVISFDNKVTWKVFKSSAWTSVVRNNSGTWQYSNAGSWTNASSNTQVQALIQATDQTAYQWTKTNIEAMVSGDWMAANGWSTDVNTLDWTTRLIDGTSASSPNNSTTYVTSAATSNITPAPLRLSAFGEYSYAYQAYKAFNQTATADMDAWRSVSTPSYAYPQSLQVDLGTAKIINKYAYQARVSYDNSPTEWKLQGSNVITALPSDIIDYNWTTLDTRTGITAPGHTQWSSYYTFTNTTPYRYYRMRITYANGNTLTTLANLKLVEATTGSASPTFTQTTFTRNSITNGNLDIRSLGWEASVNDPTSAYCLLDIEPTDSITLDTDLKAWVSINDGTNYEQITGLSIVGTNGTHNYVRGDISNITARTDKTIRLKVTSHNSKQLKLHSWSIGVKY